MYILKCRNGSYYVGHTDDIEKRMDQHSRGEGSSYVKERLPVELVYVEDFPTRDEAFNAERSIKNWSRKKKQALIDENFEKISQYAKKRFVKNK